MKIIKPLLVLIAVFMALTPRGEALEGREIYQAGTSDRAADIQDAKAFNQSPAEEGLAYNPAASSTESGSRDTYNGSLKIYIVEPESRWSMADDKPYHMGFLDFGGIIISH